MTREEYVRYRNEGSSYPLYYFYLQNCKKENPLNMDQFFMYLSQWPPAQLAFYRVLLEYDHKFNITTVTKINTGEILFYL